MHIVFLSYWYDTRMTSLEHLLAAYPTLAGWVDALHGEGPKVTVVLRFHRDDMVSRNGVDYLLVHDGRRPRLRRWQIPCSLHRTVHKVCAQTTSAARPNVVHFDSLAFPLQLRALRTGLPAESAIVVQHHAEKPWSGPRRQIQRWGLRGADGFLFAASDLASPWVENALILSSQPVYQVMEGSTSFRRQDRAATRSRTGLIGDPVILWVGRLIALKDPLTILNGFETVLQQVPNAHLHMIYGSDDLLPQVRERVASSASLTKGVTLWGSLPHSTLESFYNSADYFVLGSHYEGSGYSLVEALACGVVPVVTDIPPFRVMTDGGRIGACWTPGDSTAFAEAFLRVWREPRQTLSDRAARLFEEDLSYPAIARKAITAYSELAARRTKQKQ